MCRRETHVPLGLEALNCRECHKKALLGMVVRSTRAARVALSDSENAVGALFSPRSRHIGADKLAATACEAVEMHDWRALGRGRGARPLDRAEFIESRGREAGNLVHNLRRMCIIHVAADGLPIRLARRAFGSAQYCLFQTPCFNVGL